jgi:ABC-type Fe3+-hydroxamate transport system substrate-binding protein
LAQRIGTISHNCANEKVVASACGEVVTPSQSVQRIIVGAANDCVVEFVAKALSNSGSQDQTFHIGSKPVAFDEGVHGGQSYGREPGTVS